VVSVAEALYTPETIIKANPMSELAALLGTPNPVLLFQGLPQAQVLAALRGCAVRELPAGAILLQPGENNSSIYILLDGELAAHLDARNDASPAIPILAGECVGELSALDGKPTSALVRVTSAAKLLELPGDVLRDQVLTLPGVAGNLLLALAERMRKANAAALKTQREQLELQHLRRELHIARQLQMDMVPQLSCPMFPARDDIDACGWMEPGPKVGGNLFDCYFADRQHLFFCIGDVSGQGMAAALFMSRVVSVLRNLVPDYVLEPAGLLADVNSRLCEGNDANVFVALFCGYLHVESGKMRYSNAGHCAPLLAWNGGSKRVPVPKGALLGAITRMSYLNCDIALARDDVLLCHTDGLTSAVNAAREEFGEPRVLNLLAQGWHQPLSELLAGIRTAAGSFTGADRLEDDCTMLALRRGLPPGPRPALTQIAD
jgi:sigma-B regulation protein RsbU (phosphoserine phosphatase)